MQADEGFIIFVSNMLVKELLVKDQKCIQLVAVFE